MTQNVQWPPIGGANFTVPEDGETNWAELTDYLVALSSAQGTTAQKEAVRIITSSPSNVNSANDCVVSVELSPPAPAIVNLPVGVPGQKIIVVDGLRNAGTHNITVQPAVGETIQGQSAYVMNANGAAAGFHFVANDWKVTAQAAGEGAGGGVARSSIDSATPNYVVINAPDGKLGQEQRLSPIRGGLGQNASSWSGYVKFTTGTASQQASIPPSDLDNGIPATKIGAGGVDDTEFSYLDGVTSPIQGQINTNSAAIATKADSSATATALNTKVTGPASSVDGEVMLYSGTTGKVAKRLTGNGVILSTAGVASVGVPSISQGGTGQTTANAALNALLPSQAGNSAKILSTNGSDASWVTYAGGLSPRFTSSNGTIATGEALGVNSTGGVRVITLPVSAAGTNYLIFDDKRTAATNKITVTPNGSEAFIGLAPGVSIDINVNGGWIWIFWDGTALAYLTGGTGSGGGLTPTEITTSLNPAVTNTQYEYGTLSAPLTLTLPGGTTALAIGVLGSASTTNTLTVNLPNGDQEVYRYPNFAAIYYRAAGSSTVQVSRQAATLYTPTAATATDSGVVSGNAGIPGNNTGATIGAGKIGENIIVQNTTGTGLTTGGVTLATINLTTGTWLLSATTNVTGASAGDNVASYWGGVAANSADVARTDASPTTGRAALPIRPRVVSPTTNTSYSIGAENTTANRGSGFCTIVAVRIG